MIPQNKLAEGERQFIDCVLPILTDEEIVLLQGYDSEGIIITVLHSIHDIVRRYKNVSIAILVPNNLLINIFKSQILELNISNIQISNYFTFIQNNNKKFDYIFVIEAMELTFNMIKNLSAMTNILILSNNSILSNNINPYTKEPSISKEELVLIVNRTWKLSTIYGLTKSLVRAISYLIPKMNFLEVLTDNTKTDVTPTLAKASSKEQEVEYILSKSKDAIGYSGQTVAIVLPTQKDVIEFMNIVCKIHNINIFESSQKSNYLTELNQYLKNNDIDIAYIGNKNHEQFMENINQGKIIVVSYKNIRLIKFDNIFLPFFSENLEIDIYSLISAISSAEYSIIITYTGKMHEFVKRITPACNEVDIDKILSQSNNNNDFDDDFDFKLTKKGEVTIQHPVDA